MDRGDRRVDLVLTDLDNTLYDWEAFFIPSFQALLAETSRISGVSQPELEVSFRRVYQRHRTTEYAFALQELDALEEANDGLSPDLILKKYDSAIHAFRSIRKRSLRLYDGVRETLEALREMGVLLVAHSDSPMGYVSRRLRQLDIDEIFDAVCAPRDHGLPVDLPAALVRQMPEESVMARTRHLDFDPELRKPDPATLDPILEAFPVPRARILYVGDNLSRDVLLARRAGIPDVWARYGAKHEGPLREQLLRITYWTDADVAGEAQLRSEVAERPPSYVIDRYSELLDVVALSTKRQDR